MEKLLPAAPGERLARWFALPRRVLSPWAAAATRAAVEWAGPPAQRARRGAQTLVVAGVAASIIWGVAPADGALARPGSTHTSVVTDIGGRQLLLAWSQRAADELERASITQAADTVLQAASDARTQAESVAVDPAVLSDLDEAATRINTLLAAMKEPELTAAGPLASFDAEADAPEGPESAVAVADATPGSAVEASPTAEPGSVAADEVTSTGTATGTSATTAAASSSSAEATPRGIPPVGAAEGLDDAPVTDPAGAVTVGPADEADPLDELRTAVQQLAYTVETVQGVTQQTQEALAGQQAVAAARAAAEAAAAAQAEAAAAAARRARASSSLDGYANGQIPLEALCSPDFAKSAHLRCDAAEQLDALEQAFFAQFGAHLSVTDSYRSLEGQVTCRETKGEMCADPGTSKHGWGLAVDLGGPGAKDGTPEHEWLLANVGQFGWMKPDWSLAGGSLPEPWHFEYVG